MEAWKDIPGYEGKYQVSDMGRVKSLARVNYNHRNTPIQIAEKILKPYSGKAGYLTVNFWKDWKRRTTTIHTLVATAFIQNEGGVKDVNHIDGNKHNNTLSNLEWATRKQNVNHAIALGLWAKKRKIPGKKNGENKLSKKVLQLDECGNVIKLWGSLNDTQRHGFLKRSVSKCCNGLAKSHRNFRWQFVP